MDWSNLSLNLKHARELSARDWLTLLEAWLRLPFHAAALRLPNYARLADSSATADSSARGTLHAEHIAWLVRVAARLHFIPCSCLVQALTVRRMLAARRISAQIRIGAYKSDGALRAHAWVEVNGSPIGEAAHVTKTFNILRSV